DQDGDRSPEGHRHGGHARPHSGVLRKRRLPGRKARIRRETSTAVQGTLSPHRSLYPASPRRRQMKRTFLRAAGALALAFAFSTPAVADYPDRPIKLVVGYAAGGTTDLLAR